MSKARTMKGFRRSEHVIEISDTVGGHVIIMNYTVLKASLYAQTSRNVYENGLILFNFWSNLVFQGTRAKIR